MAYNFERVFRSSGTELSSTMHKTSLEGATNIEYDGRYMWVTCDGGVAIFEWWGAASGNEPAWETLDELTSYGYKQKLKLVTYISISDNEIIRSTSIEGLQDEGATPIAPNLWTKTTERQGNTLSPYWIKKCAGKMYVTSGANFFRLFEFDIQKQNFIRQIAFPISALSNLGVSGGKLWFVDSQFDDTKLQKLYSYNPQNGALASTDIPVRPAFTRTWIETGYNGSVYITNPNNVSVSRFSDVTGDYQGTIRVNADPTRIFSGPDRRIWVSSFGGMLSLIDHDDNGIHNDFSSGIGDSNRALSLAVDPSDGTKIWFVNSDFLLSRQDLNTHEQLDVVGSAENDWQIEMPVIAEPIVLCVTEQMYFQDEQLVTRVLKPHLFFAQDGALFAVRLENYLYREVYATVNGQAAVVMGPKEYFGD